MTSENEFDDQSRDNECNCDHNGACCKECTDDIEVVELEDENGDIEEFAILEEVDFEGRHFAVMAPLLEVQSYSDKDSSINNDNDIDAKDLSIEIFEVDDDNFTVLEDEVFANRLLSHLDEVSVKLEAEGQ